MPQIGCDVRCRKHYGVAARQIVQRPGHEGRSGARFEPRQALQHVLQVRHAGARWNDERWVRVCQQRHRCAFTLEEHGDRGDRRKGELQQLVLVDAEAEAADVEQQADVETGGWLEDAHLQAAAPRRGRPVDQALRVVGSIVADGRGARWIRDGTAAADHVQRRVMER